MKMAMAATSLTASCSQPRSAAGTAAAATTPVACRKL